MKDIYELLNDINIDENEFEEMEVSELEKAKVKNRLRKSINKNIHVQFEHNPGMKIKCPRP